jgi:intracellular sulfur oxidation DsrE/DsrF family protein
LNRLVPLALLAGLTVSLLALQLPAEFRPATAIESTPAERVFPLIAGFGGVVALPDAVEPPRTGAKVVFDVSAGSKPAEVNIGLERVARLFNLYGAAGKSARNLAATVILHGDATTAVLKDDVYRSRFEGVANPSLPLIQKLREAGVQVLVCGQALHNKNIPLADVTPDVRVAASAMTVLINRQQDGYAYVPVF